MISSRSKKLRVSGAIGFWELEQFYRDFDTAYAQDWLPEQATLIAKENALWQRANAEENVAFGVYVRELEEGGKHCAFALSNISCNYCSYLGGRHDYLANVEREFDSRTVMQRLLFDIQFWAWKASEFTLEKGDGNLLDFSAPSILRTLLATSNVNYYALSPRGCYTRAATLMVLSKNQ